MDLTIIGYSKGQYGDVVLHFLVEQAPHLIQPTLKKLISL